ncbi:iron-containing alcohol dehydrogenase [Thioclava sp. A2]|uniref:iron-containing alcohol dehydrogenase n=1 Tax=Thioclava sp. FCG-A2 TaxID=3080562 RepID=UPI0029538441|nr:iron-containing alcohol dehydrogenase [Thioclava sp. A2]MDV7269363.1 iron-containing alcohol dehydrogenase [Thioclava sp. A2]
MTPFSLLCPQRTLFGRGTRASAAPAIRALGQRIVLVASRSVGWRSELEAALQAEGAEIAQIFTQGEPSLPQLLAALDDLSGFGAEAVVGLGGGSALDLAKALAALLPAQGNVLRHFEIVGDSAPLDAAPLPFIAIPTTSGTGAEATKNAVISMPDHHRKVSLRDDRMMAALAVIDPALTDHCPRAVTLASGLDAVTQVIEPYLCVRANPLTDALCREAIPTGLCALVTLMAGEDAPARDALSKTSYFGGIALANAGLGAVHGLAGVLGGVSDAPHGAICGRLLPEVLPLNRQTLHEQGRDTRRFDEVAHWIASALGGAPEDAFATLGAQIDIWGLPRLSAFGIAAQSFPAIAEAARSSSSMKANPVALSTDQLVTILARAA